MIPKSIHQTWRDRDIPERFVCMTQSWREKNPGWTYRLWTDDDLDRLVREHYPDFLPIFRSYEHGVSRADAGRYLILHRHGGVYADIDTTCLAGLDPLESENRIVLAEEPREHVPVHGPARGLDRIYFNGVIASPQGHEFWLKVLDAITRNRHARNILDATGPFLLTSCLMASNPAWFAVHSCHLFTATTSAGAESADAEFGPFAPQRFALHHWASSWFSWKSPSRVRRFKHHLRRIKAGIAAGRRLRPEKALAALDGAMLSTPLPEKMDATDQNFVVLVPVCDAEAHLDRCFELIGRLDLPKDRLKLVFCEGDSTDRSHAMLQEFAQRERAHYRGIAVLKLDLGTGIPRRKRWRPALQRKRRGAIARVRNHLVEHGIDATDDWVLWLDADVCDYPRDIVQRLMAERAKIVVPNCVLEYGGKSYDLNSFVETMEPGFVGYYKYVRNGLYQPPTDSYCRLHLHDLRHSERVPLTGIGGTMILAHASIFRAGLRFPEVPYKWLIETEGFGRLARDAGITPIGLPKVEIRHVVG